MIISDLTLNKARWVLRKLRVYFLYEDELATLIKLIESHKETNVVDRLLQDLDETNAKLIKNQKLMGR